MKKWLVVSVIAGLCLVAAVLFYELQISNSAKVASLESVVPEGVIYYLRSDNPYRKINELQSCAFYQQLLTSPVYNKFIAPRMAQITKKVPFLKELTENEIGFGIFSSGEMGSFRIGAKAAVEDFIFLSRAARGSHMKLKKGLADFYLSAREGNNISQEYYKNVKISSCKISGTEMTISYCGFADITIISNSVNILKQSIDLYKKGAAGSLSANKYFVKLNSRIKRDSILWVFANPGNSYRDMLYYYAGNARRMSNTNDLDVTAFSKMQPLANLANAMEGAVAYVDYDDARSGLIFKSYQAFNKQLDKDNLLGIIAYTQPLAKDAFNLMPRFITAFYGISQDFYESWKLLKKFIGSMEEMMKTRLISDPRYAGFSRKAGSVNLESLLKKAEDFLELNIDKDVMPLLGNNFAVVFTKLNDVSLPVPRGEINIVVPEIYALLELKDPAAAKELMAKVTQRVVDKLNIQFLSSAKQKPGIPQVQPLDINMQPTQAKVQEQKEINLLKVKVEEYKGKEIFSIDIPFVLNLFSPSYTVLDKYIVFSFMPDTLKKVISLASGSASSINSSTYFEAAKDKVSSDYSQILFFNLEKLLSDFRSTKAYVKIRGGMNKNNKNDFTAQDLDSTLDMLSNISIFSFTNARSSEEIVESSCYVKIKGL